MQQKAQEQVDTDVGIADVYVQGPRGKTYKCPLCLDLIEQEWHVVITPRSNETLHRHVHTECLERFKEYGLVIKLSPGGYRF